MFGDLFANSYHREFLTFLDAWFFCYFRLVIGKYLCVFSKTNAFTRVSGAVLEIVPGAVPGAVSGIERLRWTPYCLKVVPKSEESREGSKKEAGRKLKGNKKELKRIGRVLKINLI